MFLRNAWYVAAWADEVVADRPFGRTLLDEPVVLFREAGGAPVALEDRCCHRHYPLSRGRMVDGALECGYHGLTFDGTGKCIRIPAQTAIPESACVRRYPVVERNKWIWIWMGDPALADPAQICDFRWLDHPQWGAKGAVFHVQVELRTRDREPARSHPPRLRAPLDHRQHGHGRAGRRARAARRRQRDRVRAG